MNFANFRDFLAHLEQQGELKRITYPINPYLEMTEIADRVLRREGPALLFENPIGFDMPVLCNLFGSAKRVAMGMGREDISQLREVGEFLAFLREPDPPKGIRQFFNVLPKYKQILNMPVKHRSSAPCQDIVYKDEKVDLTRLPIMHCWPEDVAPLLSWGLTITKGPYKDRQNIGIYRLQLLGKNKLIMRWLSHRGGALDFAEWQQVHPNDKFPIAVAVGADPATILAAVTPVPDTLSEYAFAGLLRGKRTEVVKALSNDLDLPATAEIILEGYIDQNENSQEFPI